MLVEMDFENKENIQIKEHQVMDFLSCSEIFCESIVESKPLKQNFQHQMYPKLMQVKAQVDLTIVEDERVLLNLVRNEQRYLPKYPDYFRSVQIEVKPHMRKIVSDWMLEVCQELHCPPEVFCLAMNLMDRFLAKCRIEKSQLQLLGAVCLFLSSKFKETVPIPSEKLVMYTDFSCSMEDIREWELLVLYKLKWDLSASTGLDYLDHVLPRLPINMTTDMNSLRRQTETAIALSSTHYLFSYVRPSVIAASAVALSLRSQTPRFSEEGARTFLQQLQLLTHTETAELEACSNAMLQSLPAFLTTSLDKPSGETQDCLISNFKKTSLLVKSC